MAYEQDIAASEDGLHRHITEGIMLRESTHIHIIRYDHAVIAHILAQPVRNDGLRQARWMVWIDLWVHRMRHHDCICIRFGLLNEIYEHFCVL